MSKQQATVTIDCQDPGLRLMVASIVQQALADRGVEFVPMVDPDNLVAKVGANNRLVEMARSLVRVKVVRAVDRDEPTTADMIRNPALSISRCTVCEEPLPCREHKQIE